MVALILKDILVMRRYARTIGVLALFYAALSLLGVAAFDMTPMVTLLCAMMVITSMSYDDLAKWDRYAMTLPITRSRVVAAKYLLGLLLAVVGVLVSMVIGLAIALIRLESAKPFGELMLINAAFGAGTLLFPLLTLPLLYKFGVEKARLMSIAVLAIPTLLAVLFSSAGLPMPAESTLMAIGIASPFALAALYYGSFRLSAAIYAKKEL